MDNLNIVSVDAAKPAPLRGIDLAKFLAAILVVAIHTRPFYDVSRDFGFVLVNGVSRIAVPFFFLCAGYFYVRAAEKKGWNRRTLWAYLRRILLVYAVWSLIYFPFVRASECVDPLKIAANFYRFLFLGIHYHFWYFPALASCIVVLHILFNRLRFKYLLAIGVGLYVLCLAGDLYWMAARFPLVGTVVDTWIRGLSHTRNLLLFGFLFVAIGAHVAKRPPSFDKIGRTALLSVLFLAAFVIESFLAGEFDLARDHNSGIFLVPAAYFAFLTALKWQPVLAIPPAFVRNVSVVVYCVHPLILVIFQRSGLPDLSNLVIFAGVVALSTGFGILVARSRLRPAKVLY
jgi:serine/alanine racemase